MIDFETWWNSSSADEFRRLNDDMDGRVVRPVWDAAIRATLSSQKATSAAPSPEATQPTQAEAPSEREALTDEEIDSLMPEPDGSAEADTTPVVIQGVPGYDFIEVDAWSAPLVRQTVRVAIQAALQRKEPREGALVGDQIPPCHLVQHSTEETTWQTGESGSIVGGFNNLEQAALDAYNEHFYKCAPSCSIATWTSAWRKGIDWFSNMPGGQSAGAALATHPEQVERDREDAELLDYLQSSGSTVEIWPNQTGWTFRVGGLRRAISADIREAIRAARSSEGGDHA